MDETDIQPQFRTNEESVNLIEIKIKRIGQLFNSLDPSPFLEKELDDDAHEYIVGSVAEHPIRTHHRIIIHLPKRELKRISEQDIRNAINHHFKYKAMIAERNVKRKIQEGQLSFIVGIIFLTICLFASNMISSNYDTILSNIIVEGLIISGWVAMWKPISNVLYDWWPARKDKRIYDKIATMEVEFRVY